MSRWLRLVALTLVVAVAGSGCSLPGQKDGYEVTAFFRDVGDLVPGASVQSLDVEIGSVTDIDLLYEDGEMIARVLFTIEPAAQVPRDGLQALVRQTSLLGEQFIDIVATETGPALSEDGTVIPLENTDRRVDIETFLSELSGFVGQGGLSELNRFTHAQALILEDRGKRFGETIEELDRFTSVLADRKVDIGDAIDSLASASGTIADNQATLDSFLDSFEQANVLLDEQGEGLQRLFSSLARFGDVSSRFLVRHEGAINRQFKSLRPVFRALAGVSGELRTDIGQLRRFFELFPKSLGGGPGGDGMGDYVQVDAVLCEALQSCNTKGERGDVPGQGQGR